jgi:hypothetical protein
VSKLVKVIIRRKNIIMKRPFVILIWALLALTLAACGGEATTTSQGTQSPPPTEAQEQLTAPSTFTQPTADQAASATLTAVVHQQAIEVAVQATLTAVAPTLTITSPADVPRITVQELKTKLDAGQAVVFDARRRESYIQRHIAGAISLPQSRVAARLVELPADKLAVFYCT